jgi:hypothetical protein
VEEVTVHIVTSNNQQTKSKTVELQREVFDKFNATNIQRSVFATSATSAEFMNIVWVLADIVPKDFPEPLAEKIKETRKAGNLSIDNDIIFNIAPNILPLNAEAIKFMIDVAKDGGIANFSLCDAICLSRDTFKMLGAPNMKDIFNVARNNKVKIETLLVQSIDSAGNKLYGLKGEPALFLQANLNNSDGETKYWLMCENILLEGIYEDRSIKH